MRIQHNLSAMNSLSNYKSNNSALSNNLEKLSSGYKINSAADDAAGLAISEKMRSQIAGLEKAQDNANDGISLVQTAEGALTEVNSMLTRLTTLATQSANGTYEDGVERANIQEETNALLSEIDRISESTNFNGIKLLDGSLSGKSQISNLALTESTATKGKFQTAAASTGGAIGTFISASTGVGATTGSKILANKTNLAAATTATFASGATASMKAAGITTDAGVQAAKKSAITGMDLSKLSEDDIGSSIDYTVKWTDADGNEQTTTAKLTFQGQGDGTVAQMLTGSTNTLDKLGEKTSDSTKTKNYFTDDQGNKYYLQEVRTTSAGTASAVTASNTFVNNYTIKADDVNKAIKAGLENDENFSSSFTVAESGGQLSFETKGTGSATPSIEGTDVNVGFKGAISRTTGSTNSDLAKQIGGAGNVETTQVAADAMQKFDVTKLDVINSKSDAADIANKTFEIDGNKFVIADSTVSDDQLKKMDSDLNVIKINESGSVTNASSDHIAAEIQKATGRTVEKGVADAGLTASRNITANDIVFKDVDNKLKTKGNELTLQIGDTADSYQQVNVKIQDMSSKGLGLKGLDLSTQESASKSIDTIKQAVNSVSSQRGQLGALQNRLDHTLNSLDATNQNITAAESQIRDTDMAKEMTQYSKNNILAQAAQSMLAQANSMPQGVLSLLG